MREDYNYSGGGDAWSSFTHDQVRSPVLKERLFGLTNAECNHGEDVKWCSFYLGATPTSSYVKMLYKYPQAEFPRADLIATDAGRGKSDPEYELLDTGVFGGNRYFDVVVEYAKATLEDVLMQVTTGIGASHQAGWTGTAGLLTALFRGARAERLRARIRDAPRTRPPGGRR